MGGTSSRPPQVAYLDALGADLHDLANAAQPSPALSEGRQLRALAKLEEILEVLDPDDV